MLRRCLILCFCLQLCCLQFNAWAETSQQDRKESRPERQVQEPATEREASKPPAAQGEDKDDRGFHTETVSTTGGCVISGLTDQQAKSIALKTARARAIEQVAGVKVNSASLVKDMTMVLDLVKTFSLGYITKEKNYKWSSNIYQPDESAPPIIEYTVSFDATVAVPRQKGKSVGIRAELNKSTFVEGDLARLSVRFGREARLGIFNITEDDRVTMLFPNEKMDLPCTLKKGERLLFPDRNSSQELVMCPLKGHKQNTEAFMIVALDPEAPVDFNGLFEAEVDMALEEFYSRLMKVAEHVDEQILPYQVFSKSQ